MDTTQQTSGELAALRQDYKQGRISKEEALKRAGKMLSVVQTGSRESTLINQFINVVIGLPDEPDHEDWDADPFGR